MKRPEERIDRVLEKLGKVWKKDPDQRFFQVLLNSLPHTSGTCLHCLHHVEWYMLEAWLDERLNDV